MFTEAGYLYGYGHLMRCLALAEGFREKSFEVIFIVRGEGNFSTLLSGYNYELCDWFDFGILNLYVKNNCIAIVDSYYTDENLCRFIYKKFDCSINVFRCSDGRGRLEENYYVGSGWIFFIYIIKRMYKRLFACRNIRKR